MLKGVQEKVEVHVGFGEFLENQLKLGLGILLLHFRQLWEFGAVYLQQIFAQSLK